ncbi:hypothetical protein [Candidatus Stoquefichus massiliensis]|uniref:hypothetical protein n=1 Tax=Candidatus Stoquefichus massiliensis TaxID=1470350 RepID=UPI000480169E|nr:hypothetical protein [Candidatus Stoquefichus massiliensis]
MSAIHSYDDIKDIPYQKSRHHPHMSQMDRAAQFAPFAALTGHKETISETARLTDHKKILDENQIYLLNLKIQKVIQILKLHPLLQLNYYKSDTKKDGGHYYTLIKRIHKIDEYQCLLIMEDNIKIPIEDIYDLDIIHEK